MKRLAAFLFFAAWLTNGLAQDPKVQYQFKKMPVPVNAGTTVVSPAQPVPPSVEKTVREKALLQIVSDPPSKYLKLNTWRNQPLVLKTIADSLPVALAGAPALARLETLRTGFLRTLDQNPAVASLYDSADSLFRPLQCSRFESAFLSEHTARDLEHLLTLLNAYGDAAQLTAGDVKLIDTLVGMINGTISREVRFHTFTTFALIKQVRIQPLVRVSDRNGRDVTNRVSWYFIDLTDFRSVIQRYVSATMPVSGSGSFCLSAPSAQCLADLKRKNGLPQPTSTLPAGHYNVLVTAMLNGVEKQVSCFSCNLVTLAGTADGGNPFVRQVAVPLTLNTDF
jgi:hypothetical protein